MYTIEPGIYYELNRAIHNKNKKELKYWGALAKGLKHVLDGNLERSRLNSIRPGSNKHNPPLSEHPLKLFNASFVTFRGQVMSKREIEELNKMQLFNVF